MSSNAFKISQWSSLFERYQKSSTSVTEFCHQERVTIAAFYYWRTRVPKSVWRIGGRSLAPSSQPSSSQPWTEQANSQSVQANSAPSNNPVVRFTLRSGETTVECESSSLESIELLLKWASSSRAAKSTVFEQLL